MEIKSAEKWRIERMEKAFKIVATILNLDEAQLRHLIYSIEDFHGNLQVFWHHPMTNAQCNAFDTAWRLCGEKDGETTHRVFW